MTDAFLNTIRSEYDRGDRFLKSRRQFVCFITISRMLGTFNFNEKDLLLFDLNKYSHKELTTTWELINDLDITLELKPTKRNTKNYLIKLCILAQDEWNIQNLERIKKRKAIRLNYRSGKGSIRNVTKNKVNLDFALKVNMLLPKQPWKPGIDREIIDKLSCTRLEYFDAVRILIEEGYRNFQKDGVVYDNQGDVISFDPERVDAETLQLKRDNN